jgi:hypothetical protein
VTIENLSRKNIELSNKLDKQTSLADFKEGQIKSIVEIVDDFSKTELSKELAGKNMSQ